MTKARRIQLPGRPWPCCVMKPAISKTYPLQDLLLQVQSDH